MTKLLAIALLAFAWLANADDWLLYDAARRVPWANNPAYTRCEYDWWILNTGQSSDLYLNGAYQGSESGTSDIRLVDAWQVHSQGVPIAVVDVNGGHGQRVKAVAEKVSRTPVHLMGLSRLYPDQIAEGISNALTATFKVIILATGFSVPSLNLSNACRYAEAQNALLFCPVPNAGVNIDLVPDYPCSWADRITSVVPVTATDRTGNLYGPGAAAWGTNVIGAPGRNIVCETNYTSGTSVAAPVAAGCMSLWMNYRPSGSSSYYRNALWESSVEAVGIYRIDAYNLMTTPETVEYGNPPTDAH